MKVLVEMDISEALLLGRKYKVPLEVLITHTSNSKSYSGYNELTFEAKVIGDQSHRVISDVLMPAHERYLV